MDRETSEHFNEILAATGYRVSKSEKEAIQALNHLGELKPMMDWFTDFISRDHCLTQEELSVFEELEDEDKILYGEDLENALAEFSEEYSFDFDDIVNVSNFEFMEEEAKETETAAQHLRSVHSFLALKLQNVKNSVFVQNDCKKSVTKEVSEIVTSLLELNNSLNNMLFTLRKTWDDLKEPVVEFNESNVNERFLCQQSLDKYLHKSSKFEDNLADFFKFKFEDNVKSDAPIYESRMNKAVSDTVNTTVVATNQGFPQIKCKKLVRELEGVKEHIKISREEKTLALADEKAYSLALEQMNTLIESFNSGLKISASEARLQSMVQSENSAKEEEKLCQLTQSLSLNCDKFSTCSSLNAVSGDQYIKCRRQEKKLENLRKLQSFIEKRLHCDEYLLLFIENELLKVELMIKFIDDIVSTASIEWEEIQKNKKIFTNQEDFLKKQAVQLCKEHPLIKTLNALYKLKAEDLNDIGMLAHTMEVQNKIITDVSYQLANLYNLGGSNGKNSITYMKELTNNIFSGRARQPVANLDKAMVPVKSVEQQIDDLNDLFKRQKFRFEEHIDCLTRKPHLKLLQSLGSLFLISQEEFREICKKTEEEYKKRKALTYDR